MYQLIDIKTDNKFKLIFKDLDHKNTFRVITTPSKLHFIEFDKIEVNNIYEIYDGEPFGNTRVIKIEGIKDYV